MQKIICGFCLICLLLLTGCKYKQAEKTAILPHTPPQTVVLDKNANFAVAKTIYVPIYSHIYYENDAQSVDLAANLSIRNTDMTNEMIITSVRYYDTEGKLLREYLSNPIKLNSLGTTYFVVERTDKTGGAGANFMVDLLAEKPISDPIIEAVMITAGSPNISFTSRGVIVQAGEKKFDLKNN